MQYRNSHCANGRYNYRNNTQQDLAILAGLLDVAVADFLRAAPELRSNREVVA